MGLSIFASTVIFVLATVEPKVSYKNFKVYRIYPSTYHQVQLLQDLEENYETLYSFWKPPTHVNASVDLMISPTIVPVFKNLMRSNYFDYQLYIKDVQKLMDSEDVFKYSSPEGGFNWKQYHTLSDINEWLEYLENEYPDNIRVIYGGWSYKGRRIIGVKLSFAEGNPGVFIEGGMHAREWISPATATYLLNELLTSQDPNVKNLAQKYDWYIFPVCNPDGYVYSHSTNRLWRKTRKPVSPACHGVDPNRNWGFKWKSDGTTKNPCHATYSGTSAFSEIETRSLAEYLESISEKLFAYISFHSYSQLLMFPYGHTDEKLDNYEESRAIAQKTVEALSERYGTYYRYGNIVETLYVATGGSIDWVKANLKLPVVFVYELRDQGKKGFLLPAEQIIPNGQEVLDSFLALFDEAAKYGYLNSDQKEHSSSEKITNFTEFDWFGIF
ncbi:zinc carboxypeptidase-like [Belonocnema kinseyi]|uniref:zinc carboxypeptidase-like n=1 Tax=Belonocnema kinseyi TaxID=2817044 RepID=UPI00143DF62B|nr:zinc carboxypeptidase-like [Belonocnema kinseyi]